jgi:TRAP-type C4-dicarboxylate transport system permease small subunit
MKVLRRLLKLSRDFLEVDLPAALFVVLFVSFLIGIFWRYVLRDPQSWTFELSNVSFLMVALLTSCTAQRKEDHVVFDLFYNHQKPKTQNIMRIISNSLIVLFLAIAIPPSALALWKMRMTTTQVLMIPRALVFLPYVILFVITVLRYTFRTILDILALKDATFQQRYNTGEGDGQVS